MHCKIQRAAASITRTATNSLNTFRTARPKTSMTTTTIMFSRTITEAPNCREVHSGETSADSPNNSTQVRRKQNHVIHDELHKIPKTALINGYGAERGIADSHKCRASAATKHDCGLPPTHAWPESTLYVLRQARGRTRLRELRRLAPPQRCRR